MRKSIVVAALGGVALTGIAIAAAGGNLAKAGGGFITLPASAGAASPASSIQASPAALADGSQIDANGKIADSYICVFRAGAVGRGSERAEANRSANAAGGSVGYVYGHALQGFSVRASARGVEMMQRNNRRIDYCEQDQVMAIVDPVQAQAQPGGGVSAASTQQTPPGIALVNAAGAINFSGTAWVIDTGVDLDHLDLNVDTARSTSFVSREKSADDGNGHGTHVAGTIGARNNTFGVVGVAAGARVVGVKVLSRSGSGTNSGVIAGVDYVKANAAVGDVANMSLGGGVSTALDNAVISAALAGIRFAVAAGNSSADANTSSPARANGPNIYTIAAFSPTTLLWASFSNWGQPPVDYAEPGVNILSTWKDGGYNTISGTSMAAPHMAGILMFRSLQSPNTVTRTGTTDVYRIGII